VNEYRDKEEPIAALLSAASKAASSRQLDAAEPLLLQALGREPNNLNALDLLGYVYFFQGRYAECARLCEKALTIQPGHPYALSGLGMALAKQGDVALGIEKLEAAMTAAPEQPEPYWDAAVLLIEAQEPMRAASILKKGIEFSPRNASRFSALLSKIETDE